MNRFIVLAKLSRSPIGGYRPLTSFLETQTRCVVFGSTNWLVDTELTETNFVDTIRQRVDFEDQIVVARVTTLSGVLGDYRTTPWRSEVEGLGWESPVQ